MQTTVVNVVRLIDKNKAIVAFLTPFILTVLGTLANWAITGEFNGQEVRIAVGGLLTSLGTALSVYVTKAKEAEVRVDEIAAVAPGLVDPAVKPVP